MKRTFFLMAVLVSALMTGCGINGHSDINLSGEKMTQTQTSNGEKHLTQTMKISSAYEMNEKDADPLGKPGIYGYVMDKRDGKILVVSPKAQDFSSTGGVDEFYDAVWVSNMPKDIDVGLKIKVWFKGGVLDSYPAKAGGEKYKIIKVQKPEASNLTESEALQKALQIYKNHKGVLAAISIKYNKVSDKWTIQLKNTFNGEESTIKIHDE